MQHIKPTSKGDPLCPLGFHPQVRWPTRCKRCFRDYKEHGNRNKEDDCKLKRGVTAVSSPSLTNWGNKAFDDKGNASIGKKSWTSSNNLSVDGDGTSKNYHYDDSSSRSTSWTSTPDLADLNGSQAKVDSEPASVTLPRRRPLVTHTSSSDDDYRRTSYTVRRRTSGTLMPNTSAHSASNGLGCDSKPQIPSVESVPRSKTDAADTEIIRDDESDVFTDAASSVRTDGSSTLVNSNLSEEQIESLKLELVNLKTRCEKAEKEKNDMLMRRVAFLDSSMSTKTTLSELSKFQQKIANLTEACENLTCEKKTLLGLIRQLESENKANKSTSVDGEIASLKSKLQAAESVCEELMEENEEMKRELRDMEEEIEEMQDNFRENEVDEYSSIKKELEQTGKNCRILSFKLRKSERKAEQLEAEKLESERKSKEAIQKLQKELDEVNEKLHHLRKIEDARKKAPMLGNIPKVASGEKVSRASLTRGGSQEDPVQLLRDLQDSIEREADLREQLRYAEEEAQNLRKKVTRVEEDNESLLMQLKKMATKAKSCRSSPSQLPVGTEPSIEKDEGISDDDDPAELKVLLDLSEQESAVLRKKVEELEENCDILKRKASDLQDKLLVKDQRAPEDSKSQKSSKSLENEMKDVKKKLLEKESECNRLKTEVDVLTKKNKNTVKTRSVNSDQERIDVERQLGVVEQEASVLRTRIYSLESENEKLTAENKQLSVAKLSKKKANQLTEDELKAKIASLEKQLKMKVETVDPKVVDEIKELKQKCVCLESENSRLTTALKIVRDESVEELCEQRWKRTPKVVTDSMSKNTLKKMIQDLEREIESIFRSQDKCFADCLKKVVTDQSGRLALSELDKTREKLANIIKENEEEKVKLREEKRKLLSDEKRLKEEKVDEKMRYEDEKKRLTCHVVSLSARITQLDEELSLSRSKLNETSELLAAAVGELEQKNRSIESLKCRLEGGQSAKKEEEKLKSELLEKTRKIADLEKKMHDIEEKFRKSERLAQVQKEKILSLEKEIETARKINNSDKLSGKNESAEKFALKIEELTAQIENKCAELRDKESKIVELENLIAQLSKNDRRSKNSPQTIDLERKLSKASLDIKTLTQKLKLLEDEKLAQENAAQTTLSALKNEITLLKSEVKKMETNLETERAASYQYKEEQTKLLLNKDDELKLLKKKIASVSDKRIDELKKDFDTKADGLKVELQKKREEYQELTGKYEQLEDEHVKLKCQSNLQKEQLQSQIGCLQKELVTVQNELRTLRETYNCRQDGWIKEKLRLEEKVKDLEAYKSTNETHKLEVNKLKLDLEVKESEFENLQKNNVAMMDQVEHMRKENEELSKKLDDFDKVISVQRSMVAESTSLDSQLRELKNKLHNEKEGRKVEVSALKLRYENHVSAISDELKDVQSQVLRLKHERDTYKHLLEDSSKTVADSKSGGDSSNLRAAQNDMEELKSQVMSLEQQISCMEDEFSEARIENSRLKTELVSERSAWHVQLSEMTSKINQLEEERLLHSGRTKTAGLKTRMELSWQKERQEQIRLLQETSTLARDLRQTLFEVERERDKERLEMKRRIDQMKKNSDEEQDEAKKKLHELQCDLLELRDAHAKLRTTNEKLRREKESSVRQILRVNSMEYSWEKISSIIDIILHDLAKVAAFNPDKGLPPVPPKKHVLRDSVSDSKNASRESSIVNDDSQYLVQKLIDLARQVRGNANVSNREAARKAFASRRPASTESDKSNETYGGLQRRGSLYRKCISLEQTASNHDSYEPRIWRGGGGGGGGGDDDTDGSVISFQSTEESSAQKFPHRYDQSFDSRLSGGSTHSEMLSSTLERKKKKGFLGKLKKLTKSSRSMDSGAETLPSNCVNQQSNRGSDACISSNIIPYPETVAKKDIKTRITGIFRSSDSRSNSMERSNSLQNNETCDTSEVVNENINSSQTLPRRTVPSHGKMSKHAYTDSSQSGATMPRIMSPRKHK